MVKHIEQFKRQVVDEYLGGEIGVVSLAERHGLHHSVVRRWIAGFREHGEAAFQRKYSHYDAQFRLMVLPRLPPATRQPPLQPSQL